jgi:hypothetical protein
LALGKTAGKSKNTRGLLSAKFLCQQNFIFSSHHQHFEEILLLGVNFCTFERLLIEKFIEGVTELDGNVYLCTLITDALTYFIFAAIGNM